MRIVLFTIFLSSLVASNAVAGTPGEVSIGGHLHTATLYGFDGTTKNLSDYRGKPLLINVWASWCGPCRAETGSLERLAKRYNRVEFNVIGISTDDDHHAAVSFIRQTGITFENFHDKKLQLENMLGADTIPLTILVDADGRVLEKVRGAYDWDSPKTIAAIKKLFRLTLADDPMFGLRLLPQ